MKPLPHTCLHQYSIINKLDITFNIRWQEVSNHHRSSRYRLPILLKMLKKIKNRRLKARLDLVFPFTASMHQNHILLCDAPEKKNRASVVFVF